MVVYIRNVHEVDICSESARTCPVFLSNCPSSGVEICFTNFFNTPELTVYRRQYGAPVEVSAIGTSLETIEDDLERLLRSELRDFPIGYTIKPYSEYLKYKKLEQKSQLVREAAERMMRSLGVTMSVQEREKLSSIIIREFPSVI
ncbi:MAG: hypothetical protein NC084_06335 [Bacteroides sp.]|nr:hypothetical protein [Eubacterium sp.]MCM1418158.1 hypothetical protein [Roseburia sp.]MCM1462317.1 hypothetical protein [Bacteroides sp.]